MATIGLDESVGEGIEAADDIGEVRRQKRGDEDGDEQARELPGLPRDGSVDITPR
jgi:hypothetical protein